MKTGSRLLRSVGVFGLATALGCGPTVPSGDTGSDGGLPDSATLTDTGMGFETGFDSGTSDGGTPSDDPFSGLPLVEEIDPAATAPMELGINGMSSVASIMGKQARVIVPDSSATPRPTAFAYRVGVGKNLEAGKMYMLEVEYPDDVPRGFFMFNRGGDLQRGWATGTALGDARRQYTSMNAESLAYPQTHTWKTYRQIFTMSEHLLGLQAVREPTTGSRPFTPSDGFHLIFLALNKLNDPRSEGLAIGRIRLYGIPNPDALTATVHRPPADLPQHRFFWREEMGDIVINNTVAADRAFGDAMGWFRSKFRLMKMLGIDTYAKDLLEFGYNQGFDSGDQNWMMNAQVPLTSVWTNVVSEATQLGISLVPYYEYKGAIGLSATSLGKQRRAEKLYHGRTTTGDMRNYTGVWWVEDTDADLTDPDTLTDVRRLLDRTVGMYANTAKFPAVWFRTRNTSLPISFADATIARFRAAFIGDTAAQAATQATLIASYEGDKVLYNRYITWWLAQRAGFLRQVRDGIATATSNTAMQLIYTPWIAEALPDLRAPDANLQDIKVVTSDTAFWNSFGSMQTATSAWRWIYQPRSYDEVVAGGFWAQSLNYRQPLDQYGEVWHSAPSADPANYTSFDHVMMSYPFSRMYTTAADQPMGTYRSRSDLTVIHHFPLNETDGQRWSMNTDTAWRDSQPFANLIGYASVDVDRASDFSTLAETRAVAFGDPTNIAWLCGHNFSTGFPLEMRQFMLAFQSVPALTSVRVSAASSDAEVIVRETVTPTHGTYYYVANTSLSSKSNVAVTLRATGASVIDLVRNQPLGTHMLTLTLRSGELRAYHVE